MSKQSDLTTRERVGLTVNIELMAKLRKHSKDTDIPMSKLLDRAIKHILETPRN